MNFSTSEGCLVVEGRLDTRAVMMSLDIAQDLSCIYVGFSS